MKLHAWVGMGALLLACAPAGVEQEPKAEINTQEPAALELTPEPELKPVLVEPPTAPPQPPEPLVAAQLTELPEHPGLAIGPALQGAEAERVDAALALLSDGSTAAGLPKLSSDEGKAFDSELVEKMAPPPVVVERPVKSKVTLSKPRVSAGLPQNIVYAVVRRHTNELRYCYDVARRSEPSLKGKLELEFLIQANGDAGSGRVSNDELEPSSVGECVGKRVRRWTFPSTSGEVVTVTLTMAFEPGVRSISGLSGL